MSDVVAESSILREHEHRVLPVPGVWRIDPGHSCLLFECRHMMLTPLLGWFSSFSGDFHIAEEPEESWVEVTMAADSLEMANPVIVSALKSDKYLDVERFESLGFRSREVRHVEASLWQVVGDLTIRDVTREVVLDAEFQGVLPAAEQFGGGRARMAFIATTSFDRREFGLDTNVPLPGGGWLVGNRVELRLSVEAVLD